jgi:hypothetical protein
VSMVMSRKPQPGSGTRMAPVWLRMLSRPTAIPKDCTRESPIVPNLVYWVIFFLPASPS